MRTYKRKTENGTIPPEVIRQGVQKILEGGKFATVAREMHIPRSTLKRYTQKFLTEGGTSTNDVSEVPLENFIPRYKTRKIFTAEDEKSLENYLIRASQLHHGLSTREALFVEADNFSSDSENEMVFDDNSDLDVDMDDCTTDKDEVSVGDFILVEFLGKRVKKYFAGEVKEDTSEGYVVNFLRRKSPSWKFVFPEVADESLVPQSDIVMKLPVPRISGGTERAAKALVFDVNLSEYSVE
ncbi:hypothetical protein QYM36_009020 [Artemia franciscana]|uniref:HTH psq-type domain-containing protein n=2 Tax=Artemia franciscana TaxID=6661 RepID=A0AA88HS02_ARTSF|nr:hypothetical protein QYM36_009020 [Artemia franciscana]